MHSPDQSGSGKNRRPTPESSPRDTALLQSLLAAAPWFAGLDEPRLHRVAESARHCRLDPGEVVFRQGEDLDELFVIEDGWVKVTIGSAGGREQTLHVLGPGEVFSGLNLFVQAPNPATVVALEPAILWRIPRRIVVQLLGEDSRLAWGIIQRLAGHLQHLTGLVEDLSLRTVEARLARLLLEEARQDVVDRRRWATQAEMAARIGTVADVLQRTLRNLEKHRLIEVQRQQIRILNRPGLRERAT